MKTMLHYFSINDHDHPRELVEQLCTLYPPGIRAKGMFDALIPEDDPRVAGIENLLSKFGLSPYTEKSTPRTYASHYKKARRRAYDESDFEGQELLQLWPESIVKIEWLSGEHIGVRRGEINSGVQFGRDLLGPPILVPERIRRALVSEDFRGLIFRPLKLLRNTRNPDDDSPGELDWSSVGGSWWIIDSAFTMPRLSPYLQRVDTRTNAILPRESRATIREPGFDDVEFHYLRIELARMPEFDVARDFESPGISDIIVSRRFYEFCKAHNLKCGFKPVRIDEG